MPVMTWVVGTKAHRWCLCHLRRGAFALALAGCGSSPTTPDDKGNLGYARFVGIVVVRAGIPGGGAQVELSCYNFVEGRSWSTATVARSDGKFSADLEVPGTLLKPSPQREYDCVVAAVGVPSDPSFTACRQFKARYGSSVKKRAVVNASVGGGDRC